MPTGNPPRNNTDLHGSVVRVKPKRASAVAEACVAVAARQVSCAHHAPRLPSWVVVHSAHEIVAKEVGIDLQASNLLPRLVELPRARLRNLDRGFGVIQRAPPGTRLTRLGMRLAALLYARSEPRCEARINYLVSLVLSLHSISAPRDVRVIYGDAGCHAEPHPVRI